MMPDQTSLDQLRHEIKSAIENHLIDTYGYESMRYTSTEALEDEIDKIIAVFVGARDSRSRQLAILNLIGLEVLEERGEVGVPEDIHWEPAVLVCRVRPQEEKTT